MSTPNANPNSAQDWELIDVSAADHEFVDRLPRAISFAAAGTLSMVRSQDGTAVVIPSGSLAAGIMHPCSPSKITTSNTTVTGIVAWY